MTNPVEFRAYFKTYDDHDRDVILPQYVNLAREDVMEAIGCGLVLAERLENHTSGDVVESWSGNLGEVDAKAGVANVGGRWAARVVMDAFWFDILDRKLIETKTLPTLKTGT